MRAILLLLPLLAVVPAAGGNGDLKLWLESHGRPPVEYLLSAFDDHRLVIAGEGHWIRHDAELIAAAVPRLAGKGVGILAAEMFPADEQERIDRLVVAEEWNQADAVTVLRAAAWPYRQYLDILRAAWKTNQGAPGAIRIVAFGPPSDFRERGIDPDEFMAQRILEEIGPRDRALVYAGLHHGFTRYEQPTILDNGRVDGFMVRMGGVLRQRLDDDVFLVVLHRPFWCGSPPRWTRPGGAIRSRTSATSPTKGSRRSGQPSRSG
ncbi:MAG TPA: ChaN family lipoprotein [Thermoanaerobaculia bacterium]|nr:ChaN family lipoprotein [Thermoanaerobaculia bacterium]